MLAGVKSHEGDVVPVGQIIAWIVAPGEQPPAESAAAAPMRRGPCTGAGRSRHGRGGRAAAPRNAPDASAQISPKARRIAKEQGVDLSTVRGTGPGGTITSEDVQAAAKAPAPAPAAAPPEPSTPATERHRAPDGRADHRKAGPRSRTSSWSATWMPARSPPRANSSERAKITHTDLLIALVARVLAKHPKMNASWTGGGIRLNPSVNISMAIAVKDGVVGAVIPNANTTALADIAAQRRDWPSAPAPARLRPADITGGTFTISNLGMYGVDAFSAIITPPQAAILAVGRIADRVVPVDGKPGIRPMMTHDAVERSSRGGWRASRRVPERCSRGHSRTPEVAGVAQASWPVSGLSASQSPNLKISLSLTAPSPYAHRSAVRTTALRVHR